MKPFNIPSGYGESELTEKRSRFIGRLWQISSEEEAKELIRKTEKQFHDARHTCWCYCLKEGAIERYSDDGEPQGTAGQPMLEMFRKRGIQNYCCTVTRYFGGILLGTGGLVRAYTGTAALALEQAGISEVRLWRIIETECAYNLLERVRIIVSNNGGIIQDTDYGTAILISALLPAENAESFCNQITDLSSGTAFCMDAGEKMMAARIQ